MRLDDGPPGGLVLAFVNHVEVGHQNEIFLDAGIDSGQGLRLSAGVVEAAFRIQRGDLLAAPKHVDELRQLIQTCGSKQKTEGDDP